jgi:hypothetical protein
MSTKIQTGGPASEVSSTHTASRVTAPPARPFKQVLDMSAGAVVTGAEAAMRRLPGGPVLAAAVRPGQGAPSHVPAGATPEGSGGTAGTPGGSGGIGSSGEPSMDQVLSENADKNLYYLQLQERISAESRSYTALSNVLKARHDTIKNAIGNIR